MNRDIGVIIVTYNRLDKLKTTLDKFDKQTLKPKYVMVVDNAITDMTGEYLSQWYNDDKDYEKYIVTNATNEGGSGGFYAGLKNAMQKKADWIWVSDDDAFPDENALYEANKFLKKCHNVDNISAICGAVINNGKIDVLHRKNLIKSGFGI